jgi:hypothetical protein
MFYLNRRLFGWLLGSVVLGIVAFYVTSLSFSKALAAEKVEIHHPLTAQITKNTYSAASKLVETDVKAYSRYSDGSIVSQIRQTYPANKPISVEIIDATRGQWVILDTVTSSATTLKKTPEVVRGELADLEEEGCPDGVDIAKLPEGREIEGFKTLYYADKTDPGETIEKWIVPELGCFAVQEIQTSYLHHGSHNVILASSVVAGEPAEDLRIVPPSYIERDPITVDQLHMEATGEPFWGDLLLRKMKKEYFKK